MVSQKRSLKRLIYNKSKDAHRHWPDVFTKPVMLQQLPFCKGVLYLQSARHSSCKNRNFLYFQPTAMFSLAFSFPNLFCSPAKHLILTKISNLVSWVIYWHIVLNSACSGNLVSSITNKKRGGLANGGTEVKLLTWQTFGKDDNRPHGLSLSSISGFASV